MAKIHDIAISHSEEFVLRAKLGEKVAFNKLVSLWYKRIYNFCYKYFVDHDLASDAAQKTFIKVYERMDQLDDTSKFKQWLYIIALNICREESRKTSRSSDMLVRTQGDDDEKLSIADDKSASDSLEAQELSDLVLNTLNEIPEEQRTIVIMKEYEGMKFREIADVLNLSENTVKSRLYYGLKAMKKLLENNSAFKESYGYGK